jgi:2-dehydropantoate 2-reductase
MEEVVAIANADGSPVRPSIVDEHINATKIMKPYKTSMLLDYEAGRPMEVEAILGNAVRKAEKLGVKVPHMKTLYGLLYMFEHCNRSNNTHP